MFAAHVCPGMAPTCVVRVGAANRAHGPVFAMQKDTHCTGLPVMRLTDLQGAGVLTPMNLREDGHGKMF
eukprot:366390-Chlamydomonas_euryale.AAC.3